MRRKTPYQVLDTEAALDYLKIAKDRLKGVEEPSLLMRLNAIIGDLKISLENERRGAHS